jgi:chemotaxis protein MotA
MAETKRKPKGGKIDLSSILGLVVAVGCILGGLILDGGNAKDVAQVTAAMIVLGGTLGAVMVTMPISSLMGAAKHIGSIFIDSSPDTAAILEQVVALAAKARREGLVSLEQDADGVQDPTLKKALNLAIDGTDISQIKETIELEIRLLEHRLEAEAKVFEAAGGYAPTVGIIGAVLGLIQVMKNLANIDEVGRGIAVAFVATVYGVASANLVFLPAAQKLKSRLQNDVHARELSLEGVIAIVEGLNPKLIRAKLEAYAPAHGKKKKGATAPAESRAGEGATAGA